ncbi:MAG TPA: hypothetical protein DDW87_07780 [Firmicutes bacterium]|nr:hypothetical protein [Bacillota bacterium]
MAIGVGGLVYGILIYFMKIPEVEQMVEALRNRVRGRSATGQ